MAKVQLKKLSEKRVPATLRAWIWPGYRGQNGPKSTASVAFQATLQSRPRLFRQFLRDCLESPDRLHFMVPRACATRVKVSFSAPRASKRRAMQPFQLLSRQSLEKLSEN